MNDESQDTGYLILSLKEAMEESRRLRQELKAGNSLEQPEVASPEEAEPITVPAEII